LFAFLFFFCFFGLFVHFLALILNSQFPRAVGQINFMNNPITGVITMLALISTNPGRVLFGVLGMIIAHLTAWFFGFDSKLTRTGFYGYNAFQCSMALCAFLAYPPPTPYTWWMLFNYVGLVSVFSCILVVAIASVRVHQNPLHQMTYPFSIITLIAVLMAQKYNRFPINEAFVPTISGVQVIEVDGRNITSTSWDWSKIVNPGRLQFDEVMRASLSGVGQIYLNPDWLVGLFLLIGMAFCSRISAMMSFIGSLVGVGTAQFMGVPQDQIMQGIWGYSGALAGLAIGGTFYVFSWRVFVFACFAACVATFINAGLASFLSVYGIPTMSFAFLFTNTLFTMIQPYVTSMTPVPIDQMTYAEEHVRKFGKQKGGKSVEETVA
jgi:solute carrier family 14 (urea transporter)